ncbi:hypothetical protein [Nocardia jinanensis]|uniref:Uncharacterized protein n=1 Tax=Nocardia jinanensis TaxID=382504 RepID=A0A917VVR1_9NOCA|nr:hypothetical protein [Nocardia jinanensis]GGL28121.1 hypothetical protein GCM10011588_48730 [Nocardia jinanensis]
MGDLRRARRSGGAGAAIERIGALLDGGSLRNELVVAALVLSSITVVLGLTSDGFGWKAGYCLAGILGVTASFVVLRRDRPRQQWAALIGIAVLNVLLLVVYGRMSGSL